MNTLFTPKAFDQYVNWQTENKKTADKINALIVDISRNGLMKGLGKPEVLKHIKGYSRLKAKIAADGSEKTSELKREDAQ
jgi:toxin YoeB